MLQKEYKILVVDDDHSLRNLLSIVLKKEGYTVFSVDSGLDALNKLKKNKFDLMFTDMKMPDINGLSLLKKIRKVNNPVPVIMITAYASTDDAVEAMKLGAQDYLTKPFNIDELKIVVKKVLHNRAIEDENVKLKAKLEEKTEVKGDFIGKSHQMQNIFRLIESVARTDSTVLITGESGTGKELIARSIHRQSCRNEREFVSINCAAMPENLLESELFGHVKGSFTDAYKDKEGLFEVADNSTLFLDEIGEMPINMQVKLLRVIQERNVRRIGSNKEIPVDVRIIAATNRDIESSIRENRFRSDLYYRLNVIPFKVPPLRQRREDIPLLMNYFLKQYNEKFKRKINAFDDDVMEMFLKYSWPGNVRELENFIERAVALEKNDSIGKNSFIIDLIDSGREKNLKADDYNELVTDENFDFNLYIDNVSRDIICAALSANDFNIKKTAQKIRVTYRSLRYLIDKLDLKGFIAMNSR